MAAPDRVAHRAFQRLHVALLNSTLLLGFGIVLRYAAAQLVVS